jgi:glucosamine--fructose-6-phosphate aminotransferase (isomerizing)
MCGIVAYSGKREFTLPTLVTGLKRLEYRGYDSAGVAYHSDGHIKVTKAVGKVVSLEDELKKIDNQNIGGVGIAHTRWATHGPATVQNAHPHSSADRKIWVVHNGIIENYRELKEELEQKGIVFESETDTEVVAKLLGILHQGDLRGTVLEAVTRLKGAFSLAIIHEDEPNRLIGVRMASPLVVGITDDEVILASDVSAIVERTKRVIYLEDGELIDINGSNYEILSFDNKIKEKEVSQIDWDVQTASKGNYDHYLLKEIMEQPQVIHDSIRGRIVEGKADVKFGGLIDVMDRIKTIDNVVLLGVGTSFYAAKMGELYFNALSGIRATAVLSPEYRYTKNIINDKTWLIAISQSGETADTIAALEEAKLHGAMTTGLVNVVGSTISRITHAGIYNHIGPEISVASTKAFTSQSLLLLMQAILLGRQRGLDFLQSENILKTITGLPDVIDELLKDHSVIEEVARTIHDSTNLIYLGRQYNYPIALEGALKIKEIAYIHAEGLSAGELKHGFIALIDEKLPTIALVPDDSLVDKMIANVEEVKARGGRVIAVANRELPQADKTIIVPKVGSDYLQPLVNNVVLQLLAYYVAKNKDLNIDQPRNLAKSVTVE